MKAQIVSFHCVLKDRMDRVISQTFNRDVMTAAEDPGPLLRGLAEGLQDLKVGEKRTIALKPEQAYGFYDPELVLEIPRRQFVCEQPLSVGLEVQVESPEGDSRSYRVIQVMKDRIVLDGNHPLAGQDLVFEIEATEAREATPEEVAETAISDSYVVDPKRVLH